MYESEQSRFMTMGLWLWSWDMFSVKKPLPLGQKGARKIAYILSLQIAEYRMGIKDTEKMLKKNPNKFKNYIHFAITCIS